MPESKAQRHLREQRIAMGVCVKCGGPLDNPRFKSCSPCRRRISDIKKRHYAKKNSAGDGMPCCYSISEVCRMAAARGISYGQMVVEIEKGRCCK